MVSRAEHAPPKSSPRLGGWLFRHRTAVPIPFAAAILLLKPQIAGRGVFSVVAVGLTLTVAGELVRLWAVRHIGAISRTRSERLGPLIATGPFALIRNPLYVGNIALWVGFALTARLTWAALVIGVLMAAEYHAIVGWEERLLESRVGEAYHAYAARVPRWIPRRALASAGRRVRSAQGASPTLPAKALYSWRQTFFSERGTLIAIALGYV